MINESPVSFGNDAYIDLERQVSKIRYFFSFNHRKSMPNHYGLLLSSLPFLLWESFVKNLNNECKIKLDCFLRLSV